MPMPDPDLAPEDRDRVHALTKELAARKQGTGPSGAESHHVKASVKIKASIKNDSARYCYCEQQADDAMLQCAGCNNWFHIRCIGFLQKRGRGQQFRCSPCKVENKVSKDKEHKEAEEAKLLVQAKETVAAQMQQGKGKKRSREEGQCLPSQRLKRPQGPYFIYFGKFRMDPKNKDLCVTEMAKACGKAWTKMDSRKKAPYLAEAAVLKAKYEKAKKGLEKEDIAYRKKMKKDSAAKLKGTEKELVMQLFEELKQTKADEEKRDLEAASKPTKKRRSLEPAQSGKRSLPEDEPEGEGPLSREAREALLLGSTEYMLRFPSHDMKTFKCCLAPDEMCGTTDMLETMQCLAMDYPACKLAADNANEAMEARDYEALGKSCELFNASLLFAKPAAGHIGPTPPNKYQTHHILDQVYTHIVKDSNTLNKYKGFSDQVYGEAGHQLVSELICKVPITKDSVFLDLGSGIGQVVMQVAAQGQCRQSYGVEITDIPATYAEAMSEEFKILMKQYSKGHGDFKLIRGSFLDTAVLSDELLASVDVVFCNNVAFSTETNQNLLERFKVLKDGAKIVSMRSFEAFQAGGRGRIRTSSNKFKFWCPCGTMGVNESHVRELRLVSCMQCSTYAHRKCNGIKTEEQANGYLCKSCVRNMSKQVETSAGVCMDVLGPFYPEGECTVSWTSSRVGYFIHTIQRRHPVKCTHRTENVHMVENTPAAHGPTVTSSRRSSPRNKDGCSATPLNRSLKQNAAKSVEEIAKMKASPSSEADSDVTLDEALSC